jgi:hypothetical protein
MRTTILRKMTALAGALSLAVFGARALASGLTITDPSALYSTNGGGITDTAYMPALITTGPSVAYYQAAFNAWNTTLPAASQWTLVSGGTNKGSFSIDEYRAYLDLPGAGGVTIDVLYNPGAGDPPKINANGTNTIENGEAVWTQVIYTDAKLPGALPGNPYLDNPAGLTNSVADPPLYPFQYVDSHFFDGPERNTSAFWYAEAYLASANFDTRTLTVYDGIGWGFSIVPEPGALAFVAVGIVVFLKQRRRLRSAASGAPDSTSSDEDRPHHRLST